MYGTSETQQLMFLTGQMARRYGLPMRTGGMRNGSKATDAIAAAESLQTMLPAVLAGGNFFLHAAGWLESGLSACFAKFLLDTDQLAVLQRLAAGMVFNDDEFALDTINEIGPGGHFLGCDHTQNRFETAFFTTETAEQVTYEQWAEEGGNDALNRASKLVGEKLRAYEPPPLEPAKNRIQ